MNSPSSAALLLFLWSGWHLFLVLPLILACPLGMWIMMRNMNRRGDPKHASDESEARRPDQTSDDDARKR